MPDKTDDYRIRCNRRRFFPLLLQEILVTFDSASGDKPGHQLDDLADLPDEQLRDIIPLRNPHYQIFLAKGHVCARYQHEDKSGREYALFPTEQPNLSAFNNMDGKQTLAEIAVHVAQDCDWDSEQAFAHVRQLFLMLASRLICTPHNPPDGHSA